MCNESLSEIERNLRLALERVKEMKRYSNVKDFCNYQSDLAEAQMLLAISKELLDNSYESFIDSIHEKE